MKIKVGLLIGIFLLLTSTVYVHAAIRQGVLGLNANNLSLPPTSEGPGYIMPDSPLYFLDNLKQQIRLSFAFTPQAKAKVYASIAGERLAELRFELLKNNTNAAEVALNGVRENTKLAALSLDDARQTGVDVEGQAKDLNLQIKQHLISLDALALESTGEMRAAVSYTTQTMADAKALVESGMQKDLAVNEAKDDLSREIALNFVEASNSATQLRQDLDLLQKQASQDAQKSASINAELARAGNKNVLAQTASDKSKLELQAANYIDQIISQLQKASNSWEDSQSK
ncbi:MAG TPA: DUF5667 domain-containing protein [Patescibacteria group bacterium]